MLITSSIIMCYPNSIFNLNLIYSNIFNNKRLTKIEKIKKYSHEYSKEYGINVNLIRGVIKVESNNGKYQLSNAGACGVMQIRPSTATYLTGKYVSCKELINSTKLNIKIGTIYLKRLIEEFHNVSYAIAAYNAGPTITAFWLYHLGYIPDSGVATNDVLGYVDKVEYLVYHPSRLN